MAVSSVNALKSRWKACQVPCSVGSLFQRRLADLPRCGAGRLAGFSLSLGCVPLPTDKGCLPVRFDVSLTPMAIAAAERTAEGRPVLARDTAAPFSAPGGYESCEESAVDGRDGPIDRARFDVLAHR